MTIGANEIALGDLGIKYPYGYTLISHYAKIASLLAAYMIKIHANGRK